MRRFYFLTAVFIGMTFFIAGTIYADTAYIIKKGDNPYTIAKKFKVSPQDIIKANNLRPNHLKPGTKITIPLNKKGSHHKDKLTKKQGKELGHKTNIINPPTPPFSTGGKVEFSEDSSFHVVKKGDTLSSISKKYSIPINELKEINDLRSAKLRIGQKIIVKETKTKNYTVKKGDTIWSIARRFDIDPDELMDINSLETDSLKPGQKILLEPEAEFKEPKTYEAILSQAHVEQESEKVSESVEISQFGLQGRLMLFAKKLLDIPYRFGGNSLLGIDCSAYVKKVYSLIGIDLPRSAREQFQEGKPVDEEDLSIGDLVFFKTYASFPSHVGIYLGNNLFIHASSKSKKVTIDSLNTPYYLKRFIGAKRLIEGKSEKQEPEKGG